MISKAHILKMSHIQFLNCLTDDDFLRFSRAWGPLYLRTGGLEDELQKGLVIRPVGEYRATARRFRGVKGILEAAKGNGDEREALHEFLSADEEEFKFSPLCKPDEPPYHQFFSQTLASNRRQYLRLDSNRTDPRNQERAQILRRSGSNRPLDRGRTCHSIQRANQGSSQLSAGYVAGCGSLDDVVR